MLNWEEIPQSTAGSLQRCEVPMGWLVKEVHEVYLTLNQLDIPTLDCGGFTWTSSITFVPDPHHEWEIEIKD